MICFGLVWIFLFINSYAISMMYSGEYGDGSLNTIITTMQEAQHVALLLVRHNLGDVGDVSQHQHYTLAPELIAHIIKKDMLQQTVGAGKKNIEISQEEKQIICMMQQNAQKYKELETAVYQLLQPSKKTMLQEVRGKLFHYEESVLNHLNTKLENKRAKVALYKTYKPHEIPLCWTVFFVLQLAGLGALTITALLIC